VVDGSLQRRQMTNTQGPMTKEFPMTSIQERFFDRVGPWSLVIGHWSFSS
jgi:hypothetical protein